ncbi:UDP-N-acetylmuramoyl-tripeptide--D-alanyl-D-alanine ligase [Nannocystis pusilla]|uniref:UDP-N-acetylmuramoyl-tripeptide--D-alanyl-D- alanine ligase n=1 Tax=Nannocystis pusilla TaxID=889268 RepID=UPI003BF184BF
MHFTPETLAATTGGRLLRAGSREIRGAFVDSRDPVPGGLFVPIVAARDGHAFIPDAIRAGAAAVLQAPGHPLPDEPTVTVIEVADTFAALTVLGRAARERCSGPVVAISGSNGKTTTRALVEAVLRSRHGRVLATRGNLNNHLGVPLSLLNGPDHPEAIVLELGMSAPGENERLAAVVRPDVAVITSVALEHLEFMGSLEAIAAAEAEPLRHVRAGGVAVVPDDEPLLPPHFPPGLSILRFGEGPDAAVRILGVELDERTHATLQLQLPRGGSEEIRLSLRVFGAHNARNAAAALAVGLHLGCPVGPMIEALEGVQPVGDRGRVLRFDDHHLLIADNYNANPGSVTAALHSLAALRPSRPGPLAAVIGDMLELGERSPELHAEVGRLAAALKLDALFTFGTLSQAAADAAKAGGIASWHAGLCVSDLVAAVRAAFAERPGALLVKGSRGMRLERVVEALLQAPPKAV